MRASMIAAALMGGLGLAGSLAAQGLSIDRPTAGIRIGDIEFRLGQFPVVPPSFALLGCDIDPAGPAVSFLQLAGSGLTVGGRSEFVVDEAQGLPCAEVISELLRAGFVIDDERLIVIGARNVIVYDLIVTP